MSQDCSSTQEDGELSSTRESGSKRELFTRAFVMAALINLCVFMGWQTSAVGIPVYINTLGGSEVEVGLVATIATITAVLFRPFSGTMVDRYGRKVFLIGGFAFIVVATIAYSIFPIVGIVLGCRVLHGVGWGIGTTANQTLAADIIPKKRFAEGMGYLAMTNSLAMALGPVVSYTLLDMGATQAMIYASAGFSAMALVVAAIFFKSGYIQPPLDKRPLGRDYFTLHNLFEKRALFPSIVMMLVCLAFGTISAFIALHAAECGISNVSIYFIVYAITNVISRPVLGRLIDQRGFWLIGILSCLCFAASLVLIGFATTYVMYGIAGVLVGLGLGTAMSVFQTMAVSTVSPQRRGVATATYFFFFDIGIGLGSLLGGFVAGALGYAWMYIIAALAPILACIVFVCAGKERVASFHVKQAMQQKAQQEVQQEAQ